MAPDTPNSTEPQKLEVAIKKEEKLWIDALKTDSLYIDKTSLKNYLTEISKNPEDYEIGDVNNTLNDLLKKVNTTVSDQTGTNDGDIAVAKELVAKEIQSQIDTLKIQSWKEVNIKLTDLNRNLKIMAQSFNGEDFLNKIKTVKSKKPVEQDYSLEKAKSWLSSRQEQLNLALK